MKGEMIKRKAIGKEDRRIPEEGEATKAENGEGKQMIMRDREGGRKGGELDNE